MCDVFCQKTENSKMIKEKCKKLNETIKEAWRNSEQIHPVQTSWGPLFDHFLGFYNFVKIGASGSIPHVFSLLGVSGQAQSFFRRKSRPFPNLGFTYVFYLKASPMPPAPTSRFGVASIVDGGSFLVIF